MSNNSTDGGVENFTDLAQHKKEIFTESSNSFQVWLNANRISIIMQMTVPFSSSDPFQCFFPTLSMNPELLSKILSHGKCMKNHWKGSLEENGTVIFIIMEILFALSRTWKCWNISWKRSNNSFLRMAKFVKVSMDTSVWRGKSSFKLIQRPFA